MTGATISVQRRSPARRRVRRVVLVAGCVLPDEHGRILLLHRHTPLSQWELPGGKVEPHEHPAEAAAREMREELGVRVAGLEGIGDTGFAHGTRILRCLWYLAGTVEGEPRLLEPECFDRLAYHHPACLTKTTGVSPNVTALARRIMHGPRR